LKLDFFVGYLPVPIYTGNPTPPKSGHIPVILLVGPSGRF
jgi:hypothetical protein